jgi:hypothetical protein
MMKSNAGTAKMQGTLNLTDSYWTTVFEKIPVDFPRFASQRVLKLSFIVPIQPVEPSGT